MKKLPPLLVWSLPVISGALFVALWYAVRAASGLQSWILPTPVEIMQAAWHEQARLLAAAGHTALGALGGFLLAAGLGFFTSLLLGVSKSLRAGLYPWLLVLQMTRPPQSMRWSRLYFKAFKRPDVVSNAPL